MYHKIRVWLKINGTMAASPLEPHLNQHTTLHGKTASVRKADQGDMFPQAHGEWTKQLFPHHMRPDLLTERNAEATVKKTEVQYSINKIQASDQPSRDGYTEILPMPIRFYMSVPPPPVAATMRMRAGVRQSVMYYQPRNSTMMATTGSIQQQVQGHLAAAQMFQPPGFGLTPTFLNWNFNYPLMVSPSMQASMHHSRLKTRVICQQNSNFVTETSKLQRKKYGEGSSSDIVSYQNSILSSRTDKAMERITNTKSSTDDNGEFCKPLIPHMNYGIRIPVKIHQNPVNNAKNCNMQPVTFENCVQQVASNSYVVQPKSQTRACDPGIPGKVQKTGMNYIRLPLSGTRTPSSVFPSITQYAMKPRYIGGIATNDFMKMQGQILYQRYVQHRDMGENQKNISDDFLSKEKEILVDYEDKVIKWLETVNQHVRSGSCINIEESLESSKNETFPGHDKLDSESGIKVIKPTQMQKNEYVTYKKPIEILNNISRNASCISLEESLKSSLTKISTEHDKLDIESGIIVVKATKGKKTENVTDKIPIQMFNKISRNVYSCNKAALVNYNKLKTLPLRHFRLPKSLHKLKKGKDFEGKIKLIKRYFAEISLIKNGPNLKRNIKIKNSHRRKRNYLCSLNGTTKSTDIEKKMVNFDMKSKLLSSESCTENFRNFPISNKNEFKVLSRENNEFNAFPSKRLKMCSLMSLFLEKEPWTHDELNDKISSMNYFDILTDNIIFSQKVLAEELTENESDDLGIVNGWTHFKVVVKTILNNIKCALELRKTQNKIGKR